MSGAGLSGPRWGPLPLAAFLGLLCGAAPAPVLSNGFIENRGQVNAVVRFHSIGSAEAVYFTPEAVVIDLKELDTRRPETRRGCAVYIRFDGGNPAPVITARQPLETQYNFFLGNDPSRWHARVPAYAELVYHDVWPGIDLVFRESGGALAYEAVVRPDADAAMAALHYEGVERTRDAPGGNETLETAVGALDHTGSALLGRFHRAGTEQRDPPEPPSPPLDDPAALLWSTFVAGCDTDHNRGLVLDASGNVVITGITCSPDFPTTPGSYETSFRGSADAFIAKISATGTALLWSTFLGGCGFDSGIALALDDAGNAVVTGSTCSGDFPTTTGAFDRSYNDSDSFVAKISATGSALLWSTFLGGCRSEIGEAIALDAEGNAVVTGETGSADFPTTAKAYDTSFNGGRFDAFVTKISSTGTSLLWSTLLGGSGDQDAGWAVAMDASGNAVVSGQAGFPDFPTTPGAFDTVFDGGYCDVFVAKISSTRGALLWCTFLGGTYYDEGRALVLDSSENAVVAGGTMSPDFPTTPGAHGLSLQGWEDAFVSKISSNGSALLWSTYLGGDSTDVGTALALDRFGNAIVTGGTSSTNFPTTPGALDRSQNGGSDVFVTEISSTGAVLLWSTFLGGSGNDDGMYDAGLALDPSGNAVLMSWTGSPDFPTTPGAYDRSFDGCYDAFVAKVSPRHLLIAEYLPSDDDDVRPVTTAPSVVSVLARGTGAAFRFTGAPAAPVTVRIFDVAGRLIRSIHASATAAGAQEVLWDGRDETGARAGPGIYFYQAAAEGQIGSGKIAIAR